MPPQRHAATCLWDPARSRAGASSAVRPRGLSPSPGSLRTPGTATRLRQGCCVTSGTGRPVPKGSRAGWIGLGFRLCSLPNDLAQSPRSRRTVGGGQHQVRLLEGSRTVLLCLQDPPGLSHRPQQRALAALRSRGFGSPLCRTRHPLPLERDKTKSRAEMVLWEPPHLWKQTPISRPFQSNP